MRVIIVVLVGKMLSFVYELAKGQIEKAKVVVMVPGFISFGFCQQLVRWIVFGNYDQEAVHWRRNVDKRWGNLSTKIAKILAAFCLTYE